MGSGGINSPVQIPWTHVPKCDNEIYYTVQLICTAFFQQHSKTLYFRNQFRMSENAHYQFVRAIRASTMFPKLLSAAA